MLSKVKDINLIKNLIGLLDSQILSLSVLKIKILDFYKNRKIRER